IYLTTDTYSWTGIDSLKSINGTCSIPFELNSDGMWQQGSVSVFNRSQILVYGGYFQILTKRNAGNSIQSDMDEKDMNRDRDEESSRAFVPHVWYGDINS